jgi:hypothetical protein
MPTARAQQTGTAKFSVAILLIVVTIAAAIVVSRFYLEGGIVLWIGLLTTALIEPPTARPLAKGEVETPDIARRNRHYASVRRMSKTLFAPADLFSAGAVETSLILTVLVGVLIATLPLQPLHINAKQIDPLWLHLANGVFGAVAVFALYGLFRGKAKGTAPYSTIQSMVTIAIKKEPVALILVAGVSGLAGVLVTGAYSAWLGVTGLKGVAIDVDGALLLSIAVTALWVSSESRKLAQRRGDKEEEWLPVWGSLGLKNTPTLIHHHDYCDGVEAQWFRIPLGDSIANYASMKTMDSLSSSNQRVFIQRSRILEGGNERIYGGPGDLASDVFRILSWEVGKEPTFQVEGDEPVDLELYSLWIESAISWATSHNGMPMAYVMDLERVSTDESQNLMFEVELGWPEGPFQFSQLASYIDELSGSIGAGVYPNCFVLDSAHPPDNQTLMTTKGFYIGTAGEDELTPDVVTAIKTIQANLMWTDTWNSTGLLDPPLFYYDQRLEYGLSLVRTPDLTKAQMTVDLFSFSIGQTLADVIGTKERRAERMLTALPATHAAVRLSSHNDQERVTLVDVIYTDDTVENDLSQYSVDCTFGVQMLFNCLIDEFLAQYKNSNVMAIGARVVSVPVGEKKPGNSKVGNIWEITAKVGSIDDFKLLVDKEEDIRRYFGCEWVRIAWGSKGTIHIGLDMLITVWIGPSKEAAEKAYAPRTLRLVEQLDLQHAWRIAGVRSKSGDTPVMASSKLLAGSTKVSESVFDLPEGITPDTIRASLSKLKAAASLAFISLEPIKDSPQQVKLLTSSTDPLELIEPYDESVALAAGALSLGRGIDGGSVDVDVRTTPHLLINGPTGTGKAQPLDETIPVPVSRNHPLGYADIAALEIGDYVFGEDGNPVGVIGLSKIQWQVVVSVNLANGVSIRCSRDHLWRVKRRRPSSSEAAVTLATGVHNIAQSLHQSYRNEATELLVGARESDTDFIDAVLTTEELRCLIAAKEPLYVAKPGLMRVTSSEHEEAQQELLEAIIQRKERWEAAYSLHPINRHTAMKAMLDAGEDKAAHTLASSLGLEIVDGVERPIDGDVQIVSVEYENLVKPMRCLVVNSDRHLYMASGGIPTHNSVLGSNLIVAALQRGDDVYVIDPVKRMADYASFKPYLAGYAELDVVEALGLLQIVKTECARRKEINARHMASNFESDLIPEDERYPHMFVMIDEAMSLLVPKKGRVTSKSFEAEDVNTDVAERASEISKQKIGTMVSEVMREARSLGVTVALGLQKLDKEILNALPLDNDTKENAGRILLGTASSAVRQSVLRQPENTPELAIENSSPGRGVFEPISGRGAIFQGWYVEKSQLAELLSEMPTKDRIDPMSYVPRDVKDILSQQMGGEEVLAEDDEDVVDDDDFMAALADISGKGSTELVEDSTEPVGDRIEPVEEIEITEDVEDAEQIDDVVESEDAEPAIQDEIPTTIIDPWIKHKRQVEPEPAPKRKNDRRSNAVRALLMLDQEE